MKTLQAYAVIHTTSHTTALNKVTAGMNDLHITYHTDTEDAVAAMSNQHFQLLIIDKALPDAEIKKLNRLAALLHPDAVITEFNLEDEDYMLFKLSGLMMKWADAQSEQRVNFMDNPQL